MASHLPDRSPKQCRERFHSHLDANVRKGCWTEHEDTIILEMQRRFGNQWSSMAAVLQGRTDNDIKNRFFVLQRAIQKMRRRKRSVLVNIHHEVTTENLTTLKDFDNSKDKESQSRRDSIHSYSLTMSEETISTRVENFNTEAIAYIVNTTTASASRQDSLNSEACSVVSDISEEMKLTSFTPLEKYPTIIHRKPDNYPFVHTLPFEYITDDIDIIEKPMSIYSFNDKLVDPFDQEILDYLASGLDEVYC